MQPELNRASNYNSQDNRLTATGFKTKQYKSELRCGRCRKAINTNQDSLEPIYIVEQSLEYGFLCGDCGEENIR